MKNFIIMFFILSHYFSLAQISGKIINDDNEAVEFATILNLNKKTSSITNKNGIYKIEGEIGDSIRVQHVTCITREFKVSALADNYMLIQKNNNIGVVTIAAKYATTLFKKSCMNTFNSLKDNNIYKGYFCYISIMEKDTTQIIDIDLDLLQKKMKNIEKGEKLKPYKIQERNEFKPTTPFCQTNPFFTYINQIYEWANYLGNSYCLKVEDSLQVKLYFIGRTQRVEAVIQKKDSCLVCVTGVSTAPLTNRKGEQIKINKSYWQIKYAFENGVGYISEMSDMLVLPNPEDSTNVLTFTQFYKTYSYEIGNIKRRPNGRRIFDNIWLPQLIKNKYDEKFWERNSIIDINIDNIESLTGLSIIENHETHPSRKSYSPLIKAYGIGIHK